MDTYAIKIAQAILLLTSLGLDQSGIPGYQALVVIAALLELVPPPKD